MNKIQVSSSVLFICLLIFSSYAETTSVSLPIRNRFSIGVNDLPWDATQVSFRWWKNETNGNELIVGGGYLTFGNEDYNYRNHLNISLSELSYIWLKRRKTDILDDLYITRGIGISLPFYVYWSKRNYQSGSNEDLTLNIPFPLKINFGIEHFFIKRYPVSYSLVSDFRASYIYDYSRCQDRTNKLYRVSLNINPRFFILLYLR